MKILAAVSALAVLTLSSCAAPSSQAQSAPPAAASGAPAKPQSCVRDLDCAAGETCYQNVCHH